MLQQALLTRKIEDSQKSNSSGYFTGLCASCCHTEYCTFPRSPERPVIQCDEFSANSSYTKEPVRKNRLLLKFKPFVSTHNMEAGGLCRSCVEFPNCRFPKTSAGSIFCDEYSNGR
jgi:hypothetical protein